MHSSDPAAARIYEREMTPGEIDRLRRQVMSDDEAQRRSLIAALKEAKASG